MVAGHAGPDIFDEGVRVRPRSKSFTSARTFEHSYASEGDSSLEDLCLKDLTHDDSPDGEIFHHLEHPQPQQHNDAPSAAASRRHRSRKSSRKASPCKEKPMSAGVRDDMAINLSFCGCGFIGMYHLGVTSCLMKYGQPFLSKVNQMAGVSSGALMAALLVTSPTHQKLEVSKEALIQLAKGIRSKPMGALTPGYRLSDEVARLLDSILPVNAHELARGKLHVSLTHAKTRQNKLLSDFESREELIEALVASCHIPFYSGAKLPTVRGKCFYDGGLSNNLIHFAEGRTVTVSPFSGKQDIGPQDVSKKGFKKFFYNFHNQDVEINFNNVRRMAHAFFPPRSYILHQYFELGHKDASRFLIREGLYEIPKPEERKPVVYESSV